jgi:hypothetical protein
MKIMVFEHRPYKSSYNLYFLPLDNQIKGRLPKDERPLEKREDQLATSHSRYPF